MELLCEHPKFSFEQIQNILNDFPLFQFDPVHIVILIFCFLEFNQFIAII